MLLAIDAGNTNTVFAIYDGTERLGTWRCATDPRRTADEYAVWLLQLMALDGLTRDQVTAGIIASVVPAGLFNLVKLVERYFRTAPLVVGENGIRPAVAASIPHPEEVGADRLVNAVAAHDRYGGPLVVVDFGTATTFDLIDGAGAYAGGVIAPGINLSLDALYRAAAKLPRVAVVRPERVVGTSTVPAMQSGVFWGYVGLVEGIVRRMGDEVGRTLPVVATGGLASMFADVTPVITHLDSDLTLWGLALIHRMHGK